MYVYLSSKVKKNIYIFFVSRVNATSKDLKITEKNVEWSEMRDVWLQEECARTNVFFSMRIWLFSIQFIEKREKMRLYATTKAPLPTEKLIKSKTAKQHNYTAITDWYKTVSWNNEIHQTHWYKQQWCYYSRLWNNCFYNNLTQWHTQDTSKCLSRHSYSKSCIVKVEKGKR